MYLSNLHDVRAEHVEEGQAIQGDQVSVDSAHVFYAQQRQFTPNSYLDNFICKSRKIFRRYVIKTIVWCPAICWTYANTRFSHGTVRQQFSHVSSPGYIPPSQPFLPIQTTQPPKLAADLIEDIKQIKLSVSKSTI